MSRPDPHELRDEIEADLGPAVSRALRSFLRLVRAEALRRADAGAVVAAAGPAPEPLTLGQFAGWWEQQVDAEILASIEQAWGKVYRTTADSGTVTQTSLDAASEYMSKVRDRLVRGIQPPIQEDAFNRVRVATTDAIASGWSRKQLANRIGAELAWQHDEPYWKQQLADTDSEIDKILDPLGPPGTPERENARLHDPRVRELQRQRTDLIKRTEQEQSTWQTRADRIARTEATGATNFAALRALHDEGWTHKRWLAARDPRTRQSHRDADGQEVELDKEFSVGGYSMQMPGDPSAPAAEIVNCRCTIVGADHAAEQQASEPAPPTAEPPVEFGTNQEARDWANRIWAGPESYTAKQLSVLRDYTAKGHIQMNRLLRSSKGRRSNPAIREMDGAIERAARVPNDVTTVRTADLRQLGFEDSTRGDPTSLVGREMIDYGYLSTSLGKRAPTSLQRNVRLQINVPRGSKGIYVSGDGGRASSKIISSSGGGENELILARGSKLRIKSVKKVGLKWHVEADLIQDQK